jgi:hypothetical protein
MPDLMQAQTAPDGRDAVLAKPADLHDLRFRALLGEAGWNRLPQAVRDRFSKRLRPGMAVTYVGEITESRRNGAGQALAQLCRLIGAPLPLYDDLGVAAVVTVTEDGQAGGQFWTRMYNQAHGFPQVIHSSKRFAGPTGLEEYLGCGFGIALAVSADETALHFHSRGYFLALGPGGSAAPAPAGLAGAGRPDHQPHRPGRRRLRLRPRPAPSAARPDAPPGRGVPRAPGLRP